VYLTNALTGWEPEKKPKDRLPFPELQEEHDAAEKVKCEVPILVILGNPPYNAFAGTSPNEEEGMVEEYKGIYYEQKTSKRGGPGKQIKHYRLNDPESKGGWGIKKFNLDDLYIRFFRIAERRIVKGGMGIVSYISNFSYLGDPSFVIMRQRFLDEFDKLWFDCMNGDSRETGKRTPEGKSDPSVFSTEQNKQGIRVGTTISLMVRKKDRRKKPQVQFRHFWGAEKRIELLESLKAKNVNRQYKTSKPEKSNRYSFRPSNVARNYLSWPLLRELPCLHPYNGPIERRGNSLIVFPDEKEKLELLRVYLDPKISDQEIEAIAPRFMKTSGEFSADMARLALKGKVQFDESRITKYPFKPFDIRLAYLDANITPLFSRPSPDLLKQATIEHNSFFITRDTADKKIEGPPFLFASLVCDYDCISGHARHFPIRLYQESQNKKTNDATPSMFKADESVNNITANLSKAARVYLKSLGISNPDRDADTAGLIWMHSLAIGYSPAYLFENADGIRQDWPRIPLPDSKDILLSSATFGKKVASLLDTESNVTTVTSGTVRPDLNSIGVITHVTAVSIDPTKGELDITAGWGHFGKNNVVMPGKGKIDERPYTPKEQNLIKQGAEKLGLTLKQAFEQLGETTHDIYMNDVAYWSNIPQKVWNYYIGGYQVIKKWLSYREKEILGRGLKTEEVHEVMNMARRIAAIILLQPALDENYKKVKKSTFSWPDAFILEKS
ncbi:MAG: DNA methyltransferase, partial [Planctomycetes bacterium]|nr:DNA methyltransferase [Planctomycetota bacterium]